jgi:hypothetical protein
VGLLLLPQNHKAVLRNPGMDGYETFVIECLGGSKLFGCSNAALKLCEIF